MKSRGNQRIGEFIQVPDSSRKEAIIYASLIAGGYLKISAAPNLGNKVICRYPGFKFQTFVLHNESIILILYKELDLTFLIDTIVW